jgi:ABC-type branched-subunit amino acid transport system substrate-binding protein
VVNSQSSRSRSGPAAYARPGKRLAVFAVAALALAVAACSSSASSGGGSASGTSSSSSSKAPYHVAIVADLTGPSSPVVIPFAQGVEAYFHMLNAHGGINGHQIDYGTPIDGQSTTTGAVSAIKTALASSPDAIVGELTGLAAGQDLLAAAKIPTMVAAAPSPAWDIGSNLYPWYYSMVGDFLGPYVQGFKQLFNGSIAGKKIDFVTLNMPAEIFQSQSTAKALQAAGATTPLTEQVDITQLSFTSEAAAIAANHPDAVAMYVVGAAPKALTDQLAADGFHGPIINFQPAAQGAVISSIASSNYYGARYTQLNTPVITAAASAAGISLSAGADLTQGWVGAAVVATGLGGCTSTCTPAVIEHTLDTTPVTAPGVLFGTMTFSSTNHLGNESYGYYHYDPSSKQVVLGVGPLAIDTSQEAQFYGVG